MCNSMHAVFQQSQVLRGSANRSCRSKRPATVAFATVSPEASNGAGKLVVWACHRWGGELSGIYAEGRGQGGMGWISGAPASAGSYLLFCKLPHSRGRPFVGQLVAAAWGSVSGETLGLPGCLPLPPSLVFGITPKRSCSGYWGCDGDAHGAGQGR